MYSSIEYSNNYSKTLGSSWQYYRDEPALTDQKLCTIKNFQVGNNNSGSFKFKQNSNSCNR